MKLIADGVQKNLYPKRKIVGMDFLTIAGVNLMYSGSPNAIAVE